MLDPKNARAGAQTLSSSHYCLGSRCSGLGPAARSGMVKHTDYRQSVSALQAEASQGHANETRDTEAPEAPLDTGDTGDTGHTGDTGAPRALLPAAVEVQVPLVARTQKTVGATLSQHCTC
jgi:hypothetical protein